MEDAGVITCTECGAPLPEPTEGGGVACPGCGRRLTVFRFPALTRRWGMSSVGVAAQAGEATCFQHADRQAEAACGACGRFLCELCRIDFNGRTLCPACLAQTQTDLAAAHAPRHLRYDKVAMLCILVSPFIYCLSFVSAIVALYICVRYRRAPLSVLPRRRWRFWVAGTLAAALLAVWIGVAGWAVYRLAHHTSLVPLATTSETAEAEE